MTGQTFLYNGALLQLRELARSSDTGLLHYLYGRRTNLGPIRHDVNAVWDLASHDVAVFNFILGASPLSVSAVGSRVLGRRFEDVGFVTLRYPGGIVAHIHASWVDPSKVREIVVVASERRIVFDDMNALEPIRVFERGVAIDEGDESLDPGQRYSFRDGAILSPRVAPSEPLREQVEHFVECLRTGDAPRSDGYFGASVVQTLEAIDRSMLLHGAPVEIRPVPVPSVA